ncbi:MAG: hypothetical protein JW909_01420 [Planctomycetes bacterium]|nr:hypothetical protein [Planctomycetota bacterium]
MKNLYLFAVSVVVAAAGCGTGGAASLTPVPGTFTPAIAPVAALPAAGTVSYSNRIEADIRMGSVVEVPFEYNAWGDPDEFNLDIAVNYTHYRGTMEGTGWKTLDEFTGHPGGDSVGVEYGTFPTSGSNETVWRVTGTSTISLGKNYFKAGSSYGKLDLGTDYDIFQTLLSYDYYVQENLSIGASWEYENISDAYSWSKIKLNIGYLVNTASPLLIRFHYGKNPINNSTSADDMLGIALDWAAAEKLLVSLSWRRILDEDDWSNWFQHINLG